MQGILNILVGLAALVAILDYFGVKPKQRSDGGKMSIGRRWKLVLMLSLVAASLALSGYGFYRSIHPLIVEKIVEKPVDRIVEKSVPMLCPEQKSPMKPSHIKTAAPTPKISPALPSSQSCPNGICIGGENNGNPTVNNFAPPDRHLTEKETSDLATFRNMLPLAVTIDMVTIEDTESQILASEIKEALRVPGDRYGTGGGWSTGHNPKGIEIDIGEVTDVNLVRLAIQLKTILLPIDPNLSIKKMSDPQKGRLMIVVGSR